MLHITDLHHSINNKEVFKGLNLSLAPGEKRLILGPSGRGKTTLFKLIMGFVPPGKGQILINGLDLKTARIQDVRQHLFYLSQDIDFPEMTTQALLGQIYQVHGMENQKAHLPWMDFLDLPGETLEKNIYDLSGGERQRLGLMVCFLLDRPIWLLDEPTSALDDALKEKILGHVEASSATVLIISHDRIWQNSPQIQMERWY